MKRKKNIWQKRNTFEYWAISDIYIVNETNRFIVLHNFYDKFMYLNLTNIIFTLKLLENDNLDVYSHTIQKAKR